MTEKEKTIQLYMNKLDLSREEAEQMWLDEQEDNLPELTAEQKRVAKEMAQADRKVETAPRKRERKPDEDKRAIVAALADFLRYNAASVNVTNAEREIEFDFGGNHYKLTLSKPRGKKGE